MAGDEAKVVPLIVRNHDWFRQEHGDGRAHIMAQADPSVRTHPIH